MTKKILFCHLLLLILFQIKAEDISNENEGYNKPETRLWNTEKYGTFYCLFPHISLNNIKEVCSPHPVYDDPKKFPVFWDLEKGTDSKILLWISFIFSCVFEYKYKFHRKCAFSARFNFNNLEYYSVYILSLISFETGFNFLYWKNKKHILSCAIYPLGWAYTNVIKDKKLCRGFTFNITLLKYEYNRCFYMNVLKLKQAYFMFYFGNKKFYDKFIYQLLLNGASIEFGLNIAGVHEWRRNRKMKKNKEIEIQ